MNVFSRLKGQAGINTNGIWLTNSNLDVVSTISEDSSSYDKAIVISGTVNGEMTSETFVVNEFKDVVITPDSLLKFDAKDIENYSSNFHKIGTKDFSVNAEKIVLQDSASNANNISIGRSEFVFSAERVMKLNSSAFCFNASKKVNFCVPNFNDFTINDEVISTSASTTDLSNRLTNLKCQFDTYAVKTYGQQLINDQKVFTSPSVVNGSVFLKDGTSVDGGSPYNIAFTTSDVNRATACYSNSYSSRIYWNKLLTKTGSNCSLVTVNYPTETGKMALTKNLIRQENFNNAQLAQDSTGTATWTVSLKYTYDNFPIMQIAKISDGALKICDLKFCSTSSPQKVTATIEDLTGPVPANTYRMTVLGYATNQLANLTN